MANILLVDDSPIAASAMGGILERRHHRLIVASTYLAATELIRQAVKIDLVFAELRLTEDRNGLAWLEQIKSNCVTRSVPVVIYTGAADQKSVRSALGLRVQNFLVKPFNEERIYEEITKALARNWRRQLFAEENSCSVANGFTPETLKTARMSVKFQLEDFAASMAGWAVNLDLRQIKVQLSLLGQMATVAGIHIVNTLVDDLSPKAEALDWESLRLASSDAAMAARLVHFHLNPDLVPPELLQVEATRKETETNHAIADLGSIEQRIERLPGWPVVESVAAGFQMAAIAQTVNTRQMVDIASNDPGLTAQVLSAANALNRGDDAEPVDDPLTAVNLLGEAKVRNLAKGLPVANERLMHVGAFSWPQFWIFQMGVGKVATYLCDQLEFKFLTPYAFTAGMLHDAGRLLMLKLDPLNFHAALDDSRLHGISLDAAEQRVCGCTSRSLATQFAQKLKLPRCYCNVIEFVETPVSAPADFDLVAIIAFARELCRKYRIGHSGMFAKDKTVSLNETPAWQALASRVSPSFNLREFERLAQIYCGRVQADLLGRYR